MCRLMFSTLLFAVYLALCAPAVMALKDVSLPEASPIEIVVIKGFDEPLVHQTSNAYTPLVRPQHLDEPGNVEGLLGYLALNQNTPWEASVQLNLGLSYYREGYF